MARPLPIGCRALRISSPFLAWREAPAQTLPPFSHVPLSYQELPARSSFEENRLCPDSEAMTSGMQRQISQPEWVLDPNTTRKGFGRSASYPALGAAALAAAVRCRNRFVSSLHNTIQATNRRHAP